MAKNVQQGSDTPIVPENMNIYTALMNTDESAKKTIGGGRLKGFTDINPMYRIKKLTELFGPVGFGWYTEIIDRWTEECPATGEVAAMIKINLYVKYNGEWSRPIVGVGGSYLVAKEKNGPFLSDEAYKMAYTDAISIACKALGMCHDVYYSKDRTKYDIAPKKGEQKPQSEQPTQPQQPETDPVLQSQIEAIFACATQDELATVYNSFGGNKQAHKDVKAAAGRKLKELRS